jgi:hypothetical protein
MKPCPGDWLTSSKKWDLLVQMLLDFRDGIAVEHQRIKRTILNETFGSSELVLAITERFMGLARVKFK